MYMYVRMQFGPLLTRTSAIVNYRMLPPSPSPTRSLSTGRDPHAVIAPKRRVAACIFGLLPRYHFTGSHVEQGTLAVTTAFKADKAEHDFSAERLLQAIVVPSFDQYLVKPNAAEFQVDVFVHNGEARRRSLLLDAWNPQALHVGDEGIDRQVSLPGTNGWPGGATPRMFASIESVLRLKSAAERAQGALYDLVVLMRSDVVWYTPFRFSLLNASYLHIARWCDVPRSAAALHTSLHTSPCRPMAPHADAAGVPDFFFAGGSAIIDRVFANLSLDFEANRFRRTSSSVNHAVVAGRLIALGLWRSVRRYLIHGFDVQLLRWQPSSSLRQAANNFKHELHSTRFLVSTVQGKNMAPSDAPTAALNCTQMVNSTPAGATAGVQILIKNNQVNQVLNQVPALSMVKIERPTPTSSPHKGACPSAWLMCICPASAWPSTLQQRG